MPDSFILFFCSFDYLNSGLPVYTFKTTCSEDKTIILPDGITKVLINSTAANKAVEPELRNFLGYMNGIISDSPLVRKIDGYIKELKESEERRKEYMLMQAFEMDARRDGIQQGIRQGKSLGLAEGEVRGALHAKLETAKKLLDFGLSIENIAQATGLSQAEVEALN